MQSIIRKKIMCSDFSDNYKICTIILAAGESKRLGTPKQLIPYKNSTLLGHTIQCTLNSKSNETVVVLGANSRLIQKKY